MAKRITTSILSCLCFCLAAVAQNDVDRFSIFSSLLSPEKLYLQTDRETYCAGDTIWVKAYLQNASESSSFAESNFIYLELISAMSEKDIPSGSNMLKEKIRGRVKIKRVDGSFNGFIVIPEQLISGTARLRAYTWWMRNRDERWMFHKELSIQNPIKDDYVCQLQADKVLEEKAYTDAGVLNPYRKRRQKAPGLDVQFLPESGRYRPEELSSFGVRAVCETGAGVKVSGTVLTDGKPVGEFTTNELGMGRVWMSIPRGTRDVSAIVDYDKPRIFSIQLPDESAVVINADVSADSAVFSVSGSILSDGLYFVIYDKSSESFRFEVSSDTEFSVGTKTLRPGINNATVVDFQGNVYAERPFFVYPSQEPRALTLSDKDTYPARGHVKGSLLLTDANGRPLDGDFSISVTDDTFYPNTRKGYNIESYYYLGSEMDTFVEDSRRYFDRDLPIVERVDGLDLVMMTHGWRYYDLPSILSGSLDMPGYGREYSQSISGRVTGLFFIDAKKSMISFLAPSIRYSAIERLDTTGRFVLEGLDFPEGTGFLVGTTNTRGEKSRMPILDEESFPQLGSQNSYLSNQPSALEDPVAFRRQAFPDAYSDAGNAAYTLKPSFISARAQRDVKGLSPLSWYSFKPGSIRDPVDFLNYSRFSVGDYVLLTVPGVRQFGDILNYRTGYSKGWSRVKFYLNAMELSEEEYWLIWSTLMEDVESIAVLTGMDASIFQYETLPMRPVPVVLIKTKETKDVPVNVAGITPLGWQKPAMKYSPKYEMDAPSDGVSRDMRATLLWNPMMKVSNGKADFDFWASDHEAPYSVIVEGVTADGTPVYTEGIIQCGKKK